MAEAKRPRVVLLGPQRVDPILLDTVTSLGVQAGPIATVTAGWEEREGEDAELAAHLGVETRNLGLWPRAEEVFREDRELLRAMRQRDDRLRALRGLYRGRLAHALEAARELMRSAGEADLLEPEREDAIAAVHALDERQRARTREVELEFLDRWHPIERDAVARHRRELSGLLDGCSCLCIAGGHVGVLLDRLRLFGVVELWDAERPVVAWSAGSMVLADEVVLFHDSPPQGPGNAEVLEPGLGLAPGVVPLPHADRRLALDDRLRVALFTRRFAPRVPCVLVSRTRMDWDGSRWRGHAGTRRLFPDGGVGELEDIPWPAAAVEQEQRA